MRETIPDSDAGLTGTMTEMVASISALKRYALALTADAHEAEDLVQESVARAIAGLAGFDPGTNLQAWLYTILRNTYRTRMKRRWLSHHDPATVDAIAQPTLPGQQSGLELEDLQRALEVLPHDMQRLVMMVGLDGVSYESAALAFGVKIGTLKSRLSRGRQMLKDLAEGEAVAATLRPRSRQLGLGAA
jgi:RNA polymerase sigma-70 factor, ECF subfamily